MVEPDREAGGCWQRRTRAAAGIGIAVGFESGDLRDRGEVVVKFPHEDRIELQAVSGGDIIIAECMEDIGPFDPAEDRDGMGKIAIRRTVLRTLDPAADEGVGIAIERVNGRKRSLESRTEAFHSERERLLAKRLGA